MAAPLFTTASGLLFHAGKIIVLAVGLPARGKTHISRALERYLRWMGIKTQVVSLGDYRRRLLGGAQKLPPDYFILGPLLFLLFYLDGFWARLSLMTHNVSYRREIPGNYRLEAKGFQWLREADLGLFRGRGPSCHIRRQQRHEGPTAGFS